MIFESIMIIGIAIFVDLMFGDPKNKYHPTVQEQVKHTYKISFSLPCLTFFNHLNKKISDTIFKCLYRNSR